MAEWHNRIVGYGEVNPEQLLANPCNWRIHPQHQQDALLGAISDIGYIRSVTVNSRTGTVIDGHLRVTLALRTGQRSMPVEYVDLTEAEEKEALLTLDPIAAQAVADREKLGALLRDVQTGEAAVRSLLAGLAETEGLSLPEFEEYDEAIADGVSICVCPTCGNEHAKTDGLS